MWEENHISTWKIMKAYMLLKGCNLFSCDVKELKIQYINKKVIYINSKILFHQRQFGFEQLKQLQPKF